MDDNIIFGSTIDALKRAMDVRAERHIVISSNIANVETPGYKAKDIKFEKFLSQELKNTESINLATTNGNHFSSSNAGNSLSFGGTEVVEVPSDSKPNGNTVNMDREMAKLAENGIMYDAFSQIIGRQFNALKEIVKEGGR